MLLELLERSVQAASRSSSSSAHYPDLSELVRGSSVTLLKGVGEISGSVRLSQKHFGRHTADCGRDGRLTGEAGKISVAHGAHIFSCRPAGANCLKSPRLNV